MPSHRADTPASRRRATAPGASPTRRSQRTARGSGGDDTVRSSRSAARRRRPSGSGGPQLARPPGRHRRRARARDDAPRRSRARWRHRRPRRHQPDRRRGLRPGRAGVPRRQPPAHVGVEALQRRPGRDARSCRRRRCSPPRARSSSPAPRGPGSGRCCPAGTAARGRRRAQRPAPGQRPLHALGVQAPPARRRRGGPRQAQHRLQAALRRRHLPHRLVPHARLPAAPRRDQAGAGGQGRHEQPRPRPRDRHLRGHPAGRLDALRVDARQRAVLRLGQPRLGTPRRLRPDEPSWHWEFIAGEGLGAELRYRRPPFPSRHSSGSTRCAR